MELWCLTLMNKCVSSIAMPPLGCGNGGLSWNDVKPLIQKKLRNISDVEIVVLEPEATDEVPEYDTSSLAMTYPRAVFLRALTELETVFDGSFDRLSLQKIVYFLQALGVPFST